MQILVTCKHKKDWMKTTKKKWIHHHSQYKAMWLFFRLSRADNSVVLGPIGLNFELVQDIMCVLITCKFKKDWINSNRKKMWRH